MLDVENMRARSAEADQSTHFVVALDGPGGRSFAICERVMLVDAEEAAAFPAGSVERLFRGHGMQAAALPGAGSAWLRTASFAQSADDDDADED